MTTQELWQSQTIETPRVTPAYLRGRADDANRKARRWNVVEYGSAVVGVIVAIWLVVAGLNFWTRAGGALLIIASLVYAWVWRRVATPMATPADLGALDTLRFYRQELERQYSAYRGQLRWTVPLYLPPVISIMYGSSGGGSDWVLAVAFGLAGLAMGVWSAESRAVKLKREIELLDLMAR